MKGLVYKDLSLIGCQGKFLITYLVIFIFIFSVIDEGAPLIVSFLSVISFMLSINCFAYDEQCDFGKLTAAAPVRPLHVALARYISGLMLGIGGCLVATGVSSVIQLIKKQADFSGLMASIGLGVCMDIFLMAIVFPLFYKFGVNKSRLVILLIVAVPAALVPLLSKIVPPSFWVAFQSAGGALLFCCGAVLLLAFVTGSVFLSGKILEKKQY